MEERGINYDSGMYFIANRLSRDLTRKQIEKEIDMIKNTLNANAIRIYGMKKDKMHLASKIALNKGLHVWYSPRHIDLSPEQTLNSIKKYARDAEKLRQTNPKVIFVLGNEFTLDVNGFYDANTWQERAQNLGHANHKLANEKLTIFLKKAIDIARKNFHGKITYASGFWEYVDWKELDFVSVNKYMFGWNKNSYEKELQNLAKYDKPVVITEFGTGSFKGVSDMNAPCFSIIDWKNRKIKGNYVRDESEQAKHIISLLSMFEKNKVYGAFPYTFVETNYPYSDNPQEDLDMASLNLIKVLKDGTYEPKESFKALSKFYKSHQRHLSNKKHSK